MRRGLRFILAPDDKPGRRTLLLIRDLVDEGAGPCCSPRTFGRLGLRVRVQAVIYAYESGLITPG